MAPGRLPWRKCVEMSHAFPEEGALVLHHVRVILKTSQLGIIPNRLHFYRFMARFSKVFATRKKKSFVYERCKLPPNSFSWRFSSRILSSIIFVTNVTVNDRLCGLVVRVSGYRYRGPGFDPRRYQIFWVVVGLERGLLRLVSLVRSIEELLEWKM